MGIVCGPDYKGCRFEYESPQLDLKDTSTGTSVVIKNNAGSAEITDGAGNPLPINGVDLRAHGHRHSRGGEDPIDFATVMVLLLKNVSPSVGGGGSLGPASSIRPDSGYSRIVPLGVRIQVSGVDTAAGETVTVRITFVYEDGSTRYVDKSYTADADDVLTEQELQSLWVNLNRIVRIDVQAASSLSTPAASVTVTVRGIQH